MFCVPATERVFWRTDSYTMAVSYDDGGALVFNGDERAYLGERTGLTTTE
jgi:hypothetical protein